MTPRPVFDPENRRERKDAVERHEELVRAPEQVEHLRARLSDPSASEPALAVCLELLFLAGQLRLEDVDPLRRGWRKRLFVKPDPYSGAPPALLNVTRVLVRSGDPLGKTIAQRVIDDPRRWSTGLGYLVLGEFFDDGAGADRLWSAATSNEVRAFGTLSAARGYVLLDARRTKTPPVRAAARAHAAAPSFPPYVRSHFAGCAVALADPDRPLWHYGPFHPRSARWLRAALDVLEDHGLPEEFRGAVLDTARESLLLRAPVGADRVEVPRETVTALNERFARAERGLA